MALSESLARVSAEASMPLSFSLLQGRKLPPGSKLEWVLLILAVGRLLVDTTVRPFPEPLRTHSCPPFVRRPINLLWKMYKVVYGGERV